MEGNAGMKKAGIGPQARSARRAAHEAGESCGVSAAVLSARFAGIGVRGLFPGLRGEEQPQKRRCPAGHELPGGAGPQDLEAQLGLHLREMNRASGAEYAARIKRELRGRFSARGEAAHHSAL